MPITTVCSPVNSMKRAKPGIEPRPLASNRVKHAPVYGPPTSGRSDATRPASRPIPGQVTDGTLTIRHQGDRCK
jgi:hypothetical protein